MTITRLWESGFEHGEGNGAGAPYEFETFENHNNGTTGGQVLSTFPKTGSYAWTHPNVNNGATGYKYLGSDLYQLRTGFFCYVQQNGYNSDYSVFFHVKSGANGRLVNLFYQHSTATFKLYVNGTLRGSAAGYAGNLYYHFGIDMKFNGTTGWVYVYIDGILAMSYSGNTGTVAAAYIGLGTAPENLFSLANRCSAPWYWDDLYIDDTNGEGAPAPLPGYQFVWRNSNGNGNSSQMTGSDGDQVDNYALVDELPPNEGTDFVRAASSLLKDSYTLADYTVPANYQITAVIPTACTAKVGIADVKLALGLRLSGVEVIGTAQTLATSWLRRRSRQPTKPGGGSWSESDFNSTEVIIQSDGTYV